MASETSGLATALKLLGAQGADVIGGAQNDLFEAEATLPLAPSKGISGPQGGRPKGAMNRSTEEWARLLLSRYRSPLTVLGELYSRPLDELVDELQAMADKHKSWVETKDGGRWERVAIDPLAVLKLQKEAALELAKYVHKQMPRALEIEDSRPRGVMILGDFAEGSADGADDLALPLPPLEQDQ